MPVSDLHLEWHRLISAISIIILGEAGYKLHFMPFSSWQDKLLSPKYGVESTKAPALNGSFELRLHANLWPLWHSNIGRALLSIFLSWCKSFPSCVRLENKISQVMCAKVLVAQSCPTLCDPLEPTRLLCPWNSPDKNIGVDSHSLLQGIFPTQGWNSGFLLHCRKILYHLSHQGSPVR